MGARPSTAYDYLAEAALMDLDNLEHNTRSGLHIAALAGTWIALIAGLAGMRDSGPDLSFAHRLPGELTRLTFKITRRHRTLAVDIRAAAVTHTLLDGQPMRITHHGQQIIVPLSDPVTRPVPVLAAPPAPAAQPPGREPARAGPRTNHPQPSGRAASRHRRHATRPQRRVSCIRQVRMPGPKVSRTGP